MSRPDRQLVRGSDDRQALDRVSRTIRSTELAVSQREVQRWGDLQLLSIDLSARAKATERALDLDLRLYDRGLSLAGGDPVKQELVLRYLQDQNSANRALIQRRFGA